MFTASRKSEYDKWLSFSKAWLTHRFHKDLLPRLRYPIIPTRRPIILQKSQLPPHPESPPLSNRPINHLIKQKPECNPMTAATTPPQPPNEREHKPQQTKPITTGRCSARIMIRLLHLLVSHIHNPKDAPMPMGHRRWKVCGVPGFGNLESNQPHELSVAKFGHVNWFPLSSPPPCMSHIPHKNDTGKII